MNSDKDAAKLPDPSERRRFPRADLVFRVRYRSIRSAVPVSEDGHPLSRADGKDISLGGVSFRTTEKREAGEVLHLAFYFDELPGEISAVGKVVRVWDDLGELVTAVRFTVIDPDDCSILATYIREIENE